MESCRLTILLLLPSGCAIGLRCEKMVLFLIILVAEVMTIAIIIFS